MLNLCWQQTCIPQELTMSKVISLFKKGDKRDTNNCRGISFLNSCFNNKTTRLQNTETLLEKENMVDVYKRQGHKCGLWVKQNLVKVSERLKLTNEGEAYYEIRGRAGMYIYVTGNITIITFLTVLNFNGLFLFHSSIFLRSTNFSSASTVVIFRHLWYSTFFHSIDVLNPFFLYSLTAKCTAT